MDTDATLDNPGQGARPRKRPSRTEEERARAEVERRRRMSRRFTILAAQLLAPLVPLISLPALTEHWYVKREGGRIVHTRPDPPLVVAASSVSLALAVLANISITLRLIDTHLRLFTVSTVSFLSTHIVVNLIALAVFGVRHADRVGYVLSTAFWLTAASSAVALAVVLLLLLDVVLTMWYTRGPTALTGKQRSLIIVFDVFITLLLVGCVCNRYLIAHLTYVDSLYFVIQSLLTEGFGDIVPLTDGARAFSLIFNLSAIFTFALVVTFIRATALEAISEKYKSQERLVLSRLQSRSTARTPNFASRALSVATCGFVHSRAQQEEEQDAEESAREDEDSAEDAKEHRYEEAIVALRKERSRRFRSELIVSLLILMMFWMVGAGIYRAIEGWSFWHAVYFCMIAFETVGYGDFAPKTPGGRAFFCFWGLAGAGVLTLFLSILADMVNARYKRTPKRSWFRGVAPYLRGTQSGEEQLNHAESQPPPGPSPYGSAKPAGAPHPPRRPASPLSDRGRKGEDQEKERNTGLDLLDHLSDAKKHVDHLVLNDNDAKNEHMDTVVRKVMDDEGFSRRNREEVENDPSFKEFVYLRYLQSKLAKLEDLAQQAAGIGKKGDAGRTSESSSG
ncbi:Potassium channel [Rhodosporidiobolus nylandii]